jgi:uncharacterized protein YgbK (DUF1537 family)
VLDAVSNDDLMRAGLALRGAPLVTSGSGLAIGLPANFGIAASEQAAALPRASGAAAIVSGSCSVATQKQVAHFQRSGGRAFAIDPIVIATEGDSVLTQIIDRSVAALSSGPVLIYSTATADQVAATQARLGAAAAGAMLEQALARIAAALVASGVGRLIVAGGETSGACVQALGVQALRIGAQIDVGVPWCHAEQVAGRSQGLHLCLKSGNFGGEDFFSRALAVLDAQPFNEPRH